MAKTPTPGRRPKTATSVARLEANELAASNFRVNEAGKLSIEPNQLADLISSKMTKPVVVDQGNLAATEVEVTVKVKF